ncbi:MAG: hypothetical protein RL331_1118 [Bacteroidota bacterium]
MAQVDVIRNGIIDRLLAISDKDYLMALLRLVDNSAVENEKIQLTKEQKRYFLPCTELLMLKTQNYKSKISLNVVSISSTSFCVNAENSFFSERTESVPFPCSKNPTKREVILSGISYL